LAPLKSLVVLAQPYLFGLWAVSETSTTSVSHLDVLLGAGEKQVPGVLAVSAATDRGQVDRPIAGGEKSAAALEVVPGG
jgi:hypothetical protein